MPVVRHNDGMDAAVDFPGSFLWGAATSAHQIEGSHDTDGRGPSVWDAFARRAGAIEGGGDASRATDSYRRWNEDLDILAELGLNAYRFSVGWSRIMPEGTGRVESRGLDHYERIVDGLLQRGIAPVVTLNHWDMPEALLADRGWVGRTSVAAFAEFTQAVGGRLGDRVEWWVTQNEPWIVSFLGYRLGIHAPGISDLADSVAAGHHMLLGHGLGAEILHENTAARVGCALSLFPCDPASESAEDAAAAWGSDGYVNRWYLDPLLRSSYPTDMREHFERALGHPLDVVRDGGEKLIGGRSDFIGINYYTRRVMRARETDAAHPFPWQVVDPAGDVTRTDDGWEVAPDSLRDLLLRLQADYPGTPLMITENGAVSAEGPTHDGRVHDVRRIRYLLGHLRAVAAAMEKGADVRGYIHWSLLDNFEWSLGYRPRFGLVHVDYPTGRRTIKDSGLLFAAIARSGSVSAREPGIEPFG
jgi:beta-glucosidase